MLSAIDCNHINRDDWSAFVLSHPHGNIFQSPEYSELCDSYPLCQAIAVAVTENGIIKGVLLGVVQREYAGLPGLLTSRAVVIGGPLIIGDDTHIASLLVKTFIERTGRRVLFSQFRNLFDMGLYAEEFSEHRFRFEEHLDIFINLDRPVNDIKAAFHPTRRKQIGRAYRRGITVETALIPDETLLGECYPILKDTYKRTGLPLPQEKWFALAAEKLGTAGILKVFTARIGSDLAGFRMVLCYNRCIYDWYAASDARHLDKYPNDVLPWEVMSWGSTNGYSLFCFGGAGKPGSNYGVRDHKIKFGGELVSFGRYERIHRPLLYHPVMTPFKIRRAFLNR